MEVALYHPEHGYYFQQRDPFGKSGDYFTASQLQPVFGVLMARLAQQLHHAMGRPGDFSVVELGPGRGEMAEYFASWKYVPVDVGRGEIPDRFRGLLFTNEFFDALPVHKVELYRGNWHETMVDCRDDRFYFRRGPEVDEDVAAYLRNYVASGPLLAPGQQIEANLEALLIFRDIDLRMDSGFALIIDYGYTERELLRFPSGTLMSYREHQAVDDVLLAPGEQDITAHVNFTALERFAASLGWNVARRESFGSLLAYIGEGDQFREALGYANDQQRWLQLKTLLYGMGESFSTLLLEKPAK